MNDVRLLIKALETNDIFAVKNYLFLGFNVNTTNSFHENLLLLACRYGHAELFDFLLAKGANVHQLNSGNQSALHMACIGGSVSIVEKLLELGLDPKPAPTKKNHLERAFPFSLAFKYQHFDIVKLFFDKNLVDEEYILNACSHTSRLFSGRNAILLPIANLLLARQSSHDSKMIDHFFEMGLSHSNYELVSYMLSQSPELKKRIGCFFRHFMEGHSMYDKQELDPKKAKSSLILNELLPSEDTIYSIKINPCLKYFIEEQGLSMNELDPEGQTLLHCVAVFQAAEYEDLNCLHAILESGYPIDILNAKGQTPLHSALEYGMYYHALYLIYRGANVNAVDGNNGTILDYAKRFSFPGLDFADPYNIELRAKLLHILKDYIGYARCAF
jgi:ankyrin repeat protein